MLVKLTITPVAKLPIFSSFELDFCTFNRRILVVAVKDISVLKM